MRTAAPGYRPGAVVQACWSLANLLSNASAGTSCRRNCATSSKRICESHLFGVVRDLARSNRAVPFKVEGIAVSPGEDSDPISLIEQSSRKGTRVLLCNEPLKSARPEERGIGARIDANTLECEVPSAPRQVGTRRSDGNPYRQRRAEKNERTDYLVHARLSPLQCYRFIYPSSPFLRG